MLHFSLCGEEEKLRAQLADFMGEPQNLGILRAAQAGEDCYADSLGWLDTEEWAKEAQLAAIEALAAEIREKADTFVLIGVGGSNNAARSVIEALKGMDPHAPEIVYAGNTLSAHAMQALLKGLEGKSVYIDCIAKNFETLEPGAAFRVLRKWLYQTYGAEEAPKRILATGTKGSALEALCSEHGYAFLEFPKNVGGRYSAVTNVGLLPMAVAGVDIRALVRGAHEMQLHLRNASAEQNEAYCYAALRNVHYQNGSRIELLSCFEPQLRWFYKWWIQLFAESEGKDKKGIFPAAAEFSEELHSIGQFIQDGTPLLFETFLDVTEQEASVFAEPDGIADGFDYLNGKDFREINRADLDATIGAHVQSLPCAKLEIGKIDSYAFGQLFYFFSFACYLSCRMMGVNPFDQPGVEAYKARMFAALGK